MSPRKWSGQEGENSIVIFRFIEVSKVDRCAGYGFLLVSPTQEGYTGGLVGIPCNEGGASDLAFFFLEGEREKDPAASLISPCNARCLTLIFLFLFLVWDKIFFSRRYHHAHRSLNTANMANMSIRYRLNDIVFYENTKKIGKSVKNERRIFILRYSIVI